MGGGWQALDSFPMLAGRMRREGRRSWVECGGGHQGGVLVREQVGFFAEGTLRPGSSSQPPLGAATGGLCHGPMYTRVNDPSAPVMTVTLTELVYSEGFACRPPAACALLNAAARHSPSSSGSDSPRRLDDDDEGEGGPRCSSYGDGSSTAPTDDGDHRTATTIRYALGLR